jgi:probable DNA repair protein
LLSLSPKLLEHLRQGGTLLVPTRARRRAVQLAYASARRHEAHAVWPSPEVLTVRAWVRRECEQRAALAPREWPRALSASEEWLLWREATEAAARGAVFFDEGLLASALQRSAALAADYGVPFARGAPQSEAGLMHEAQHIFSERCAELGAAGHASLSARLAQAERPPAAPLVAGFTSIPPRLEALTGGALAPSNPGPPPHPQRLRPPDPDGELEAIAAWCRERLAADEGAHLLVLLPGSPGRRARLASLIRGALQPQELLAPGASPACVAEEEGTALAAQAPIAQALRGLALLCGATLEVQSLRQWLLDPHWERPGAAERAALALHLSESALSALSLRELAGVLQLAPAPLSAAARALDAQLRAAAIHLPLQTRLTPRRWCERFARALAALSWPGAAADPIAAAARLAWQELLESYGELEAVSGMRTAASAVALLRELAQHTSTAAAGADAPVTVSGALEDPLVRCDGIWVGSLSADVLPQPVMPDPFLGLAAQLTAGIPQASERGRTREATSLLSAWGAATPDLRLSVPVREGDLALLPTPLLPDWQASGHGGTLWLPARLARAALTESIEDAHGPNWNPAQPLPGGTRALTLQSACPFRAYAELRLGALELPQAAPGIAMDQRGLLLHAALQALWERLREQRRLLALEPAALERLIGECVAQAAQALLLAPRGRRARRTRARTDPAQLDFLASLPAPLERECRRAVRLIGELCALERTRADFTVLATEATRELVLAGARVRMRLDRIDQTAAGQVILDYKSGRAGSPDWYGPHPTHPQLLAYLAALGAQVVALATVNVTAREVRFCGIAGAPQVLPRLEVLPAEAGAEAGRPSWEEQRRAWRELLERLISGFLAGEAAVAPAPGACDYCHLGALCRIGSHARPEDTPGAADADE